MRLCADRLPFCLNQALRTLVLRRTIAFIKMRNYLIICCLISSHGAFCQELLTDCRDSLNYNVVDINGTLWMAENLIYESELSSQMSDEQRAKQPNLSGRFYHVNEIDSICPCEWELPDAEDWIDYFNYLSSTNPDNPQIKLAVDKSHIAFHAYENHTDIFSKSIDNNPMNLVPTGRLEGSQYYLPESYADYWTHDPPNFGEGERNDRPGLVHVLPEVYEGKTHIHLRKNGFSNIHSHKHHLDPKKEKQLRKFMVRCVKKAG